VLSHLAACSGGADGIAPYRNEAPIDPSAAFGHAPTAAYHDSIVAHARAASSHAHGDPDRAN